MQTQSDAALDPKPFKGHRQPGHSQRQPEDEYLAIIHAIVASRAKQWRVFYPKRAAIDTSSGPGSGESAVMIDYAKQTRKLCALCVLCGEKNL